MSNHSIVPQILTFHLIQWRHRNDSDWFRRRPWDTWPCAASPPSVSITPPSYTLYSQPSRGVRSRRSVRVCVTAGRRRRRHPDSLSLVVGKLTFKCAGHRPPFYHCLPSDFSLWDIAEERKKKQPFSRDPPSACQRQTISAILLCRLISASFFPFPSSSADIRCEAPVNHDRGQHHRLRGLCNELAPL